MLVSLNTFKSQNNQINLSQNFVKKPLFSNDLKKDEVSFTSSSNARHNVFIKKIDDPEYQENILEYIISVEPKKINQLAQKLKAADLNHHDDETKKFAEFCVYFIGKKTGEINDGINPELIEYLTISEFSMGAKMGLCTKKDIIEKDGKGRDVWVDPETVEKNQLPANFEEMEERELNLPAEEMVKQCKQILLNPSVGYTLVHSILRTLSENTEDEEDYFDELADIYKKTSDPNMKFEIVVDSEFAINPKAISYMVDYLKSSKDDMANEAIVFSIHEVSHNFDQYIVDASNEDKSILLKAFEKANKNNEWNDGLKSFLANNIKFLKNETTNTENRDLKKVKGLLDSKQHVQDMNLNPKNIAKNRKLIEKLAQVAQEDNYTGRAIDLLEKAGCYKEIAEIAHKGPSENAKAYAQVVMNDNEQIQAVYEYDILNNQRIELKDSDFASENPFSSNNKRF